MQFSENMLSICPVMPQSHACDSLEGFLNIIGKKKKPQQDWSPSNLLRIYTGIKSITDFQ